MITNGQLFIGEGEKAGTLTVTATSVADPTKSATATVTVVDPTFAIAVDASVKNGTITPSAVEAIEGTEITLTITPDEGYRLRTGTLKVNGTAIEGTSFSMPGEDAYIVAEFVKASDLEAAIKQAESLNENAYTSSSWADAAQKLAAAKTVLNDTGASQTQIDAAANALNAAVNALVRRGDKSALNALIAEVEALNPEDYTPETWAGVAEALADAKTVSNNADAIQSEIDAAKDALAAAKDALVARADKDALNKLIAEVEALDEKAYTEDSWKGIPDALAAAKTVADDANATQEAVDAAKAALAKAVESLVASGNADELNKLIAEAKKEDLNKLTDKSADAIRDAIAKAEEVIAKRGTQKELDEAYKNLKKALDKAVKKDNGKTPTTGDEMQLLLPLTLVGLAAAAAMIALVILNKKKSTR